MPISRESRCVLTELKNLSADADHLADSFPKASDLQPFFDSIKETVIKIRECTTLKQLKEIELPHDFHYYLNKTEKEEKVKIINTPETQKAHVHPEKIPTSIYKTAEKDPENGKKEKIVTSVCKSLEKERVLEASLPTSEEKSISVASLTKLNEQTAKLSKTSFNPETPKLFKTPHAAQQTLEIPPPILNRTITKESNQTPFNKHLIHVADETMRITRSGSKQKNQGGSSELACLKISSGLKQRLQGDENKSSSSQTRSGSKRKSNSSSEREKRKKPKMEAKKKSQTSQSKQTLKNNVLRQANGPTLNPKAVIVPTLKNSIPSDINLKEKKLVEEIQKKEEKANKNRKKVLADRQLKAEEQKKKREEKMEKALQKRLLLDKEKDLDRSMNAKMSQTKVTAESGKKPILKEKNKEQEQQVPEIGPSQSQKEVTVQATNKTPKKSSPDSETYDLTPAPDSSTYDFSGDEEENEPKGKPIPSWASGVLLKSALIHQFYNPPDTNAIFGSYIDAPNLAELFGVKKNYYFKRTSSAVWNTTPPQFGI